MAEIKKVAAVAAEWWTERIANPNANNFNNGDRTSLESFSVTAKDGLDASNVTLYPTD